MTIVLYELREVSPRRTILTSPDVERLYELLVALRTNEELYEVADQDGRVYSDSDFQQLVAEQTELLTDRPTVRIQPTEPDSS